MLVLFKKNIMNDKEQLFKINMIALLWDIQDQYLQELQPSFRQGMKMLCNDAAKHTQKFIRKCDGIYSEEERLRFGINADSIRESLDKLYDEQGL